MGAALLVSIAAAAAAACGGSTTVETVVGPDGVRCQTTLAGNPSTVPPDGGSVTVNVTAARDCTWTATADVSWMQLSATSGQGNATVNVTVARNELPAARSGAVAVNDQRFVVSQEPRPCTYELRPLPQNFGAEGGAGSISVETLTGCAWTATSSAAWLRVITPSGSGSGAVSFDVAGNSGPAREASITIAGRSVTINQDAAGQPAPAPSCGLLLAPTAMSAAAAGSTHTVTLTTNPECDWTATSSASWLTVAPPGGRGAGTLTITAARNTGNARTATVTAGTQVATVTQAAAPACTVAIDPASASFTAAGGEGRVRVTTQDGCEWTAGGGASWISITSGRGTGSGEARYTVAANTATTARSATLTIGGRSHTVTQQAAAPACTYAIEPASRSFGASGGDGAVTVTTQAGCAWTATGAPAWVTVSGGQGSGSGQFSYTVQANTGASARSGSISVAGQGHAIAQEAAAPTCTYSLQPASLNFGAGGGEGRFDVVTQAGCSWTASSGAGWAVVGTGSGSGPAQVVYTVQANAETSARSTTIAVNGQVHTVTQDAAAPACTYSVAPASQSFPASGGAGQFSVTTQAGCAWSAASGAPWAEVTTPSGTGPGQVGYAVQANTATTTRQTTITVNGQTHGVMQDAAPPPPPPTPCTYSIDPGNRDFGPGGGEGTVRVTTGPSCAWSASSPVSWITVTTTGGTGSGEVRYTVAPNTDDDDREATLTIAGQPHRVRQEEGDDDDDDDESDRSVLAHRAVSSL